ncbi:MAG: hypothetical protein ACYC5O_04345 [Anaerolineae bacterium]
MKSISMSWASGVQDDEAVQCLSAVVGVISSLYYTHWPWGLISPLVGLRTFGSWVIPALPEGSPYSSFDWYVAASYDEEKQAIDGDRFLDLVVNEPWQQEDHHFDFSVVDQTLAASATGEPLPLASRKGTAAVVSVEWVRRSGGPGEQRLALRRLAAQGIGMAFGLEPHQAREPKCAMRAFTTADELVALASEEWDASTIYCDEHYRALLSVLYNGREPLN